MYNLVQTSGNNIAEHFGYKKQPIHSKYLIKRGLHFFAGKFYQV